MPPRSTVGSPQLGDLLAALGNLGAEPTALAARVGLTVPAPSDPDARVPTSYVIDLLDAAEISLGDPLVGLHAGISSVARGILFFLLLSSSHVRQGLRLLSRFATVPMNTLRVRITTLGGITELAIDLGAPEINRSHHIVDYVVGAFLRLFRRAVPGFRLVNVDLTHGDLGRASEIEQILGCPVSFRRPHNALRFPDTTLDLVPAAASPLIARQIESFAESLLAEDEPGDLEKRIAAAVRRLLTAGRSPDQGLVAHEMRMSVRTLQRRLERESLKFRHIRDGVRLEIAQLLLSNRTLSVKAIADSVRFGDTSAFSKAFTRWAGVTPTSYRLQKRDDRDQPIGAA